MTQPTPSVTDADVTRVIRRDFAAAEVAAADALMTEYGRDPDERAPLPHDTNVWFRIDRFPPDRRQAIYDKDQEWLNR